MPLSEPVPDVRSLELLRSVAVEGSIRRAAARHHLSQPAASMQLRSLEAALGLDLLDRSSGRATLTPAGTAVVEWGEGVLDAVENLVHGVRALQRRGQDVLSVEASLTVAEYFFPTWLHRFRSSWPGVSVSLAMGNSLHVVEDVRAGTVELGFIEGVQVPAGLASAVIAHDALVVVVAPGHRWNRRRQPLTAADLGSVSLIVREEGSGTREVLDEALRASGTALRAPIELPSPTAIKAAVATGDGPGVLSRVAAQGELESRRLVEVPTTGIVLDRAIRAVWRRDRPRSPAAKRFLRCAEEAIAETLAASG